ncbi:helix-turn-helix transcriptional regulator [Streptomyces alfalfae]
MSTDLAPASTRNGTDTKHTSRSAACAGTSRARRTHELGHLPLSIRAPHDEAHAAPRAPKPPSADRSDMKAAPMTTPVPISLTASEQSIAQDFVNGLTIRDIAAARTLSTNTVRGHMYSVRRKLHCPYRCAWHIVIHRILLHVSAVTAPRPDSAAPDLNEAQMQLLQAITEHSRVFQIAIGANLAPGDAHGAIQELVYLFRAQNTADLVTRAYGWRLLQPAEDRPQ